MAKPKVRKVPFVRYVSPFGSPASMTRPEAEKYLAEDTKRYERYDRLDILTKGQRQIGPPRIEDSGATIKVEVSG